jgi:hypothetical protein
MSGAGDGTSAGGAEQSALGSERHVCPWPLAAGSRDCPGVGRDLLRVRPHQFIRILRPKPPSPQPSRLLGYSRLEVVEVSCVT